MIFITKLLYHIKRKIKHKGLTTSVSMTTIYLADE